MPSRPAARRSSPLPPGWKRAYGVTLYTLPPSAVQASRPRRPFCAASCEGVTRRYGVPGSKPRRSPPVGPPGDESRAQSSGEHPGSSVTFRDGFDGLLVCVGGGARVEVPGCRANCWGAPRGGRGDGRGGAESVDEGEDPGIGFSVGGARRVGGGGGGISCEAGAGAGAESEGMGGGGMAAPPAVVDVVVDGRERETAAAEAGGSGDSTNVGTPLSVSWVAEALGVVCGEESSSSSSLSWLLSRALLLSLLPSLSGLVIMGGGGGGGGATAALSSATVFAATPP